MIEPCHEKTSLMAYANNKGADQPVHPHSLIITFVVRCLDSIIPILVKPKILRLFSVAEQVDFEIAKRTGQVFSWGSLIVFLSRGTAKPVISRVHTVWTQFSLHIPTVWWIFIVRQKLCRSFATDRVTIEDWSDKQGCAGWAESSLGPLWRFCLALTLLLSSYISSFGDLFLNLHLSAGVYGTIIEPPHEKNQQSGCAPSEDSDQPGHLPSLRVFAVRSMGS